MAGEAVRRVTDPRLIDECLTPDLAGVAKARGLVAMHVAWLRAGDCEVAALAAERDYVVVTNDRRDFMRLYASLEVHNGPPAIREAMELVGGDGFEPPALSV